MAHARAALLIVTADDFGLTRAISDSIIEAYRHGIVTGAWLMPTGRAFEHAVELARANPELDVDVHLTLDEERPILSGLRSLTRAFGRLTVRIGTTERFYGEETRRDYGRWGYRSEQELQALIDAGPLPNASQATFRRLFP